MFFYFFSLTWGFFYSFFLYVFDAYIAAWLSGVYIQSAIASVFAKNVKYPKEPIENEPARTEKKDVELNPDGFRAYVIIKNQQIRNNGMHADNAMNGGKLIEAGEPQSVWQYNRQAWYRNVRKCWQSY